MIPTAHSLVWFEKWRLNRIRARSSRNASSSVHAELLVASNKRLPLSILAETNLHRCITFHLLLQFATALQYLLSFSPINTLCVGMIYRICNMIRFVLFLFYSPFLLVGIMHYFLTTISIFLNDNDIG